MKVYSLYICLFILGASFSYAEGNEPGDHGVANEPRVAAPPVTEEEERKIPYNLLEKVIAYLLKGNEAAAKNLTDGIQQLIEADGQNSNEAINKLLTGMGLAAAESNKLSGFKKEEPIEIQIAVVGQSVSPPEAGKKDKSYREQVAEQIAKAKKVKQQLEGNEGMKSLNAFLEPALKTTFKPKLSITRPDTALKSANGGEGFPILILKKSDWEKWLSSQEAGSVKLKLEKVVSNSGPAGDMAIVVNPEALAVKIQGENQEVSPDLVAYREKLVPVISRIVADQVVMQANPLWEKAE